MEREWIALKDVPVGFVEDGVFYTYRRPQHFMRKYGGFGISVAVINELLNKNIQKVVFIYDGVKEKGLFSTTIPKILELSIFEYDYTFGFQDKQYFIPINKMEKVVLKPSQYPLYFGE